MLIVNHQIRMSRCVADRYGIVKIMFDVKCFGYWYQVTTVAGYCVSSFVQNIA